MKSLLIEPSPAPRLEGTQLAEVEPLGGMPGATRVPTKVLFIIPGLAPAGVERRLLDLVRQLPATTEMHVCVIGEDLTLLGQFQRTRAKIATIRIRRPYTEWRQLRKVLAYVREHDIAIINSVDLKTLLVALAAKLRFWRRTKLVHHLVSLLDGLSDYHKRFLWRALQFTDLVVCNGYAVKEYLIGSRRIRPRVAVVPNGVDCEHFRPSPELRLVERARQGFRPEHFVLGIVANVRSVKNYPLLLHTMQRIAAIYPHVRLVCVGGGPQLAEMRGLAEELGLRDSVVFAGQVMDVRPWIAAFDAFALCSFKEGCPNALMQAMALGVASISSNVGEVPHLTDGGRCGLLFDPADKEAFFAATVRLIADEAYRTQLASAGRERMEKHYSSAKMIDGYAALFDAARAALLRR
jgi:glycosyltransferase involved in cell wall biosynthesis